MPELTTFLAHHAPLSFAIVITFVLLMIVELIRMSQKAKALTPLEATQKMNHDLALIIDIRPNDIYRKGHIIDAVSFAPSDIREHPQKLDKFKARPLIVVCAAGLESQKIAAFLIKQGYNAFSLAGGLRAWQEANMPVIKE